MTIECAGCGNEIEAQDLQDALTFRIDGKRVHVHSPKLDPDCLVQAVGAVTVAEDAENHSHHEVQFGETFDEAFSRLFPGLRAS